MISETPFWIEDYKTTPMSHDIISITIIRIDYAGDDSKPIYRYILKNPDINYLYQGLIIDDLT